MLKVHYATFVPGRHCQRYVLNSHCSDLEAIFVQVKVSGLPTERADSKPYSIEHRYLLWNFTTEEFYV